MPKPAAERRRRNVNAGPTLVELPAGRDAPTPPAPSRAWHPVIREWFDELVASPQAALYTAADWGLIKYLGHRESLNLKSSRPSAQASANFLGAQADLLVSEGARRRLGVALQRTETIPHSVLAIAAYRRNLGGA